MNESAFRHDQSLSEALASMPWWFVALLFLLLFSQGAFLFMDGRKKGARGYWIWAIWGLTTCPMPFVLYWFCVRRRILKRAGTENK